MANKEKQRASFYFPPEIIAICDKDLELANVRSRNKFVERAIQFYDAYLHRDDLNEVLTPVFESVIDGRLDLTEHRISSSLFKLTVELATLMNILAAAYSNIIPYFEKFKLCDITEDDCQRFLNQYVGKSKANVSKIRMTLRRVLRKAQKQKLIGENPADDIVLPQVIEGQRRPITDEGRTLILKQVPNHYAGAMVLTMLCCGLRPAEIRRMEWSWIDFDNAILTVGKSKTKAGTGRKIPIPPQLLKALREHKAKNLNKQYVFVRCKNPNLPMDENAFYHAWHNFKREMDIANGAKVYRNQIIETTLAEDLEPYLLRHTFCTDCQAAGVPINVAKELMGHSDISVTAKIYTHMVDEVFEQNRQRLANFTSEKFKSA